MHKLANEFSYAFFIEFLNGKTAEMKAYARIYHSDERPGEHFCLSSKIAVYICHIPEHIFNNIELRKMMLLYYFEYCG